ncbi:MAG TPA: DUF3419 family protein [Candidatus Acidoferrales bacterium]|nr:DUF3419 family protein [Candidatus Acidoferrales bacterium]
MKSETAWRAGRLGWRNGSQRLLFGRMYEDAEIERAAFRGKGRVFCIASAGDTAQRLADEHEVVACDINPVQLAYAERRASGGPAEIGDAERAMRFARRLMPLAGWREEALREFLEMSDVAAQRTFWREHFDTWRFRVGFDLLMSAPALHVMYAQNFLSFLPAKFGEVMRKRLERGFARHPNAANPYARALLLCESSERISPKNANIRFVAGDAASWLESCPEGYFDAFTLSNILDGAEPEYRARLARAVQRAAANDAVVVLRSFGEPSQSVENNQAECDRAMLWGVVERRGARTFFA